MIQDYINIGWKIIDFPLGTKGPERRGWNEPGNHLKEVPPYECNFGLLHAFSGTACFDVDDLDGTAIYFAKKGVDLFDLFSQQHVQIVSGTPNRAKWIFRSQPLLSRSVKKDGKILFELRCATGSGKSAKDVIPPSIHPGHGATYRWEGDYKNLSRLPGFLRHEWDHLLHGIQDASDSMRDVPFSYNVAEIRQALSMIDPDCNREDWVRVGMALHHTHKDLFFLWDEWSAKGTKYPGKRAMDVQWDSFSRWTGATVTLGTLFALARRNEAPKRKIVDIRSAMSPSPPQADLNLLPEVLRTRALEISDSAGCDVMVPIAAGLGAACAAADARSRLEILPGFSVPPVLWLMTVGDPADKKSPGSRPMLSVLKQMEADAIPAFREELLAWEAEEAFYANAKKTFIEAAKDPDRIFDRTSPLPDVEPLRPQPVQKRFTVADVTSQKLVRQLADRPQGMLCYLDEMNSWVKKLTMPSSGEDRSTWVMSFEGESYTMDRVGAGTIYAENLAVSIFGNIQPHVLSKHFNSLIDDGLIQRFIPFFLRGDQSRVGDPGRFDTPTRREWEAAIRLIETAGPREYRLSKESYRVFREFQEWHEEVKREERIAGTTPVFMGAFGKMTGLVGRLALVFHLLTDPLEEVVGPMCMSNAVLFVKGFVYNSFVFFYDRFEDGRSQNPLTKILADYILENPHGKLTIKDIKKVGKQLMMSMPPVTVEKLIMDAMDDLEIYGWVERLPSPEKGDYCWLVAPTLHSELQQQRKDLLRAKQRRAQRKSGGL